MRRLIVDASAGLKLVRSEDGATEVSRLLGARLPVGIAVPSSFWLEVVNVLGRRFGYTGAATLEAVHELESIGLETVELDRPGLLTIVDLLERHGLTAYDAAYLALAISLDADLLTADRELALAAGNRAQFIGPDGGMAEERAAYRPRSPSWPAWPDAGAYLARLRAGLSD